MWIARDKDGVLNFFKEKPNKERCRWYSDRIQPDMYSHRLLFPEVKWEDEEPTEVELIIKKN